MPDRTEPHPAAGPNVLLFPEGSGPGSALGCVVLDGVGVSVQHFYGAGDHFMGKTPDGEHRVLVTLPRPDGRPRNEAVGVGPDVEAALQNSLDTMRTLETVSVPSLARIEATPTASVSFAAFEHYNPKVAPSREAYPVPDYLTPLITDSGTGDHTYRNTVAQEGWQQRLHAMLTDYIAADPDGRRLAAGLNIRSLRHLTPEQAVKLSTAFVQNVSKYSRAEARSAALTRSDQATTFELLQEGMDRKQDPAWEGNGVCRNVAANVKAVFEALKQTQADLSMLNNTYAVYGAGQEGAGYADSRADAFRTNIGDTTGHAWNTFVTVDANGSAVATIVDATWALGADAGTAIEHLDRTEVRAASQLFRLFENSEVKEEAFGGLTDYVQRLIRSTYSNSQLSGPARQGIREYATSEYLKAAAQLPEIPEDYYLPDAIVSTVYGLRGKLEKQEVATLYALDKAGGGLEHGRIKGIIADYDGRRSVPIPGWKSAENLIFIDDDLQALAYEAVGEQRVAQLSEQSGAFRARLRETRPDSLPAFDASERPADALELGHFASQNGIYDKDPATIIRRLHGTLRRVAGDDDVYTAIIVGRTDYELAKNFAAITKALRSRAKG